MAAPSRLEDVVFVLIEPQQPGNVGAVARAMSNFGLSRLLLVDPPAYDPERARWSAAGSAAALDRVRVVGTLDEALAGVHHVVGTTARHRRGRQAVVGPEEVAHGVFERAGSTAVLFGREDHGLPKEALQRCEALLRIPTAESASLNLGQAALVVARALFEEARRQGHLATGRPVGGRVTKTTAALDAGAASPKADLPRQERLVQEVLRHVGDERNPEAIASTVRALLARSEPSEREVDVLFGVLAALRRS